MIFDLLYTADWDGQWLSVVATVSTPIGGGLQSSEVLKPVRATSAKRVRTLLLHNEFVPEDLYADIHQGRFPVKKI